MVLDAPLLTRLSHKRLMATFQVEAQRGEQDLYRCITLSPRGAAISNFGELIVRGKTGTRTQIQGTRDKYLLIHKEKQKNSWHTHDITCFPLPGSPGSLQTTAASSPTCHQCALLLQNVEVRKSEITDSLHLKKIFTKHQQGN